jgi:quinol monooxygenase YgiN
MRKNAAQSHALEAGCQQFDVCQDQQNPNTIFLYEIYGDEAAFKAHKSAPHYHEFNHAIDGMVVKKSVRFLQNITHHS